jgi:hypothetical protein
MLEHNHLLERDCCRTCSFVLGADPAHGRLHCGLSYYQLPAADRRPVKLDNYPVVTPEHVCTHWTPKTY